MQQFTRNLTREIVVGGERLALTLSKEGLSVRPVGGRRPPHTMTWEEWLCICVTGEGQKPPDEQIQQASLDAVRDGAAKSKEKDGATEEPTAAPAATDDAASAAPSNPPASAGHDMKALLARLDHWLSEHRKRFQHALLPREFGRLRRPGGGAG